MAPQRYLVLANQTLAQAELTEAIRQRQQAGSSSFYLLVPTTDHGDLAARLAGGAPIAPAAGDATVDVLATEHAQHRLGQLMDDLCGVGADVDGDIAMVFQNYALYPHMTVEDNLAFGLQLRKTPRTRSRPRSWPGRASRCGRPG